MKHLKAWDFEREDTAARQQDKARKEKANNMLYA